MKRYLKIYWTIIKINVALTFAYRANFYNSVAITLGWSCISVVTIFLLTAKVSHIYNWTNRELYLLAGIFSIFIGIFHMFFSASMERFGRTISLGELDSYLLTPVDTQLFLSTKLFRPISALRVIIGVIFTIIIIQQLHITLTVLSLFILPLFIFLGIMLLYSMWFIVVTLMIWNPNLTNLIDLLYIANNFGRYPTAMVTYAKNLFLYTAIPLMLVTTVPAEFILGKVNFWDVGILTICSIGLFALSRYFWTYALKHYSSASS